jgi:hypothetical protein
MAEKEVTEEDEASLAEILTRRHGKTIVIKVDANPRALIVKTTNVVAPVLRGASGQINLGGKTFVTLLTSGSIGKLKKRATASAATEHGKVP